MARIRRPRGDGAVYYDSSKSRWVGQINLGLTPDGKRLRPKVFARTETEARTKLAELARQHQAGADLTMRHQTFGELVELWLAKGLAASTSQNTKDNYRTLLTVHLIPSLGSRKAAELRPDDIEAVLTHMAEQGYAGSTMRLTLSLTRRVLRFAERRGVLTRNVAAVVNAPSGPRKYRTGLTRDQARELLREARSSRLGNLFTVSLLLGLRPGEAAGLTWDHVHLDVDPPVLRVEQSLRRTTDGMVLTQPKTASSRRTLVAPRPCVEALRNQRFRQQADRNRAGEAWSNLSNLVFTTDTGAPLDPSNVRRSLTAVATRAGLEHMHPHVLRHATASLLSAAGVPLEQIADVLGHRSPTITADVYRHPLTPTRDHHVTVMTTIADMATSEDPTQHRL